MSTPPFKCTRCGAVFTVPLWISPDMVIGFKDVATKCPRCGADAFIDDGVYVGGTGSLARKIMDMGPEADELLAALRALSTPEARQGPEQASRLLKTAAPRLEPYLTEWYGWSGLAWVAFLGLLLATLSSLMKGFTSGQASDFVGAAGSAMGAAGAMMAEDARQQRAFKNRRKRERRERRATRRGK